MRSFISLVSVAVSLGLLAGCAANDASPAVHGKSVNHWLATLKKKDEKVKKKAVAALKEVAATDPSALVGLIDALKDREASVRVEAVRALAGLGTIAKEALPELDRLKKDRNENVRKHAAQAIVTIRKSK